VNETHVIEFSVNLGVESVKRLAANMGLTVDQNFSLSNGGVTKGLKFVGPREKLVKFCKKVGYPGQNPDLIKPTGIDAWL